MCLPTPRDNYVLIIHFYKIYIQISTFDLSFRIVFADVLDKILIFLEVALLAPLYHLFYCVFKLRED